MDEEILAEFINASVTEAAAVKYATNLFTEMVHLGVEADEMIYDFIVYVQEGNDSEAIFGTKYEAMYGLPVLLEKILKRTHHSKEVLERTQNLLTEWYNTNDDEDYWYSPRLDFPLYKTLMNILGKRVVTRSI